MLQAFAQGVKVALETFGLEKTALPEWVSDAGNFAKTMAVGDPSRAFHEFNLGTLHKPGGMLHESFFPTSPFGKALSYGLPALGAYQLLNSGGTRSDMGEFAGSTLGNFLGAPLGFAGQLAGSSALGSLGRSVGGALEQPAPKQQIVVPHGAPIDRHPLSQEMSRLTGQPA